MVDRRIWFHHFDKWLIFMTAEAFAQDRRIALLLSAMPMSRHFETCSIFPFMFSKPKTVSWQHAVVLKEHWFRNKRKKKDRTTRFRRASRRHGVVYLVWALGEYSLLHKKTEKQRCGAYRASVQFIWDAQACFPACPAYWLMQDHRFEKGFEKEGGHYV